MKKVFGSGSLDCTKETSLALATHFFFKHDTRFVNRWHPIFIAAAKGSYELCTHVIKKTAENNPSIVNHINSIKSIKIVTGYTALHFVAEHGLLDVAKLIIARVEYKNPIASHKMTPLHYAARRDDIAVYKNFMSNNENNMPENNWGWTPCHVAAVKVNIGVTPLHLAAKEGHASVCTHIEVCNRKESSKGGWNNSSTHSSILWTFGSLQDSD
jgi:ankyrin repeat protein